MADLESLEASLHIVGNLNAVTLVAIGALTALLLAWARKTRQAEGPTWGCGYVKPTERMQYTGAVFRGVAC